MTNGWTDGRMEAFTISPSFFFFFFFFQKNVGTNIHLSNIKDRRKHLNTYYTNSTSWDGILRVDGKS